MSQIPQSPVPVPRGADALSLRTDLTQARAEAERASRELERRQESARAELEQRRAALEAQYRQQHAELAEQMAPLQAQLKAMQETLWTVDLYLGREESIQVLREGAPASADTPVYIRQKVLVMAQESLVHMDSHPERGMDADGVPDFVRWLVASPENLERVVPEPKCVVAMIPTRVASRSGNVFEDVHRDEVNQHVHWIIRNGERVHMLTTDPQLKVIDRILPRRTEFTEVFEPRLFGMRVGGAVKPGSQEWMKLEAQADARRRHYMRLMLVLQGLLDRTTVLAPLPEGGINLMDVSAQDEGHVVLVQDDEDSIQLTDGREDFATWQRRLNAQLRPGMRVMVNAGASGFRDHHEPASHWSRGGHRRLHPRGASYPASGVPYLLEDRREGGLVFRYERTDTVWRRGVPVPDRPGYVYRGLSETTPTKRASCVLKPEDDWVLPFDAATVEQMRYYLGSRANRSAHFLSMVPILRAAIQAKEAEAEAERPFREQLERMLAHAGEQDPQRQAGELIHWWKLAHAWTRPLNGEPEHEGRAAAEIMAEHARRRECDADPRAAAMVAAGRAIPGVIAVARSRAGAWMAYAPTPDVHEVGVFLDVHHLRADATVGRVERERIVQHRTAAALHVAYSTNAWDTWEFGASLRHRLTRAERAETIQRLVADVPGTLLAVVEHFDPASPQERYMGVYSWKPQADPTVDPDTLVQVSKHRILKDASGVRTAPSRTSELQDRAAGYVSQFGPGGAMPWWPDRAPKSLGVRPRLAQLNQRGWEQFDAARIRHQEHRKQVRREYEERLESFMPLVRAIQEAVRQEWERQVRQRFWLDFGAGSEDLWEGHLASQAPPVVPQDYALVHLLMLAQREGIETTGLILGQLCERLPADGEPVFSWTTSASKEQAMAWEQVVIPSPAHQKSQ